MSAPGHAVELLFLWHHHQPDYRSPRSGKALLPWVRLHAVKDYLDMALRLEGHGGLRATFNFVPCLVDQLEHAVAGGGDALFDLIARPASDLAPEERLELARRCATPPPRQRDRWPRYAALCRKAVRAAAGGQALSDHELGALAAWFLIAWLDPMLLGEPEARAALEAEGGPAAGHTGALLALHARLVAAVLPAYRRLAGRGQVELSASPYAHPILPLLVDTAAAQRALPGIRLPSPGFAAPEDAARQVERAIARHAEVFGAPPAGLWPSEGSVSPEVAEIVASRGLRWMASDEGVLWRSLGRDARKRGALYRPWRVRTGSGDVSLFFRDHELSDRIGFVYQHWDPAEAAADFLSRLRRIGAEHAGGEPPVVTVALDGENCWEHYAEDGGPFLDRLYAALSAAKDIRTVTPSDVLARRGPGEPLDALHSGSWIDADFHIWVGHPEKNAAWERIARARADLVASGATEADRPGAWHALHSAEGSDWFWWFGTDHHTQDKALFDRILREHLAATYERRDAAPPPWVSEPIVRTGPVDDESRPLGFLRPVVDGRRTSYFEWKAAGRRRGDTGAAMHRGESGLSEMFYGFDETRLFLRLDLAPGAGTEAARLGLVIRSGASEARLETGAGPGRHEVRRLDGVADPQGAGIAGAACVVGEVVELEIPLAALGLAAGHEIVLTAALRSERGLEGEISAGTGTPLRVTSAEEEAGQWSA